MKIKDLISESNESSFLGIVKNKKDGSEHHAYTHKGGSVTLVNKEDKTSHFNSKRDMEHSHDWVRFASKNESVEELDEVSKETLKSYVEKSLSKGVRDAFDGKGDISQKRKDGLNKAMKKVYGESELDEVSKDSYGYPSHSYDKVIKKLKDGEWDTSQDVVKGKHIEVKHTQSGKRQTIHVKESVEELEEHPELERRFRKVSHLSELARRVSAKMVNEAAQEEKEKKEKEESAESKALALKILRAKNGQRAAKQQNESTEDLEEAHKINDKVEIVKGSSSGIKGYIGEIRHGNFKGAAKTYTVYHGEHGAVQVPKEHIRAIKEDLDEGFTTHKPESYTGDLEGTVTPIHNAKLHLLKGFDAKEDKDGYSPTHMVKCSKTGSIHTAYTRDGELRIRPYGKVASGVTAELVKHLTPGIDKEKAVRESVEELEESNAHKVIANALGKEFRDAETPETKEEAYKKHIERMKAKKADYIKNNPKSIYK